MPSVLAGTDSSIMSAIFTLWHSLAYVTLFSFPLRQVLECSNNSSQIILITTFFLLQILTQHFQLASYTRCVPSLARLQRISMIGSREVIQSFLQCPLHLIFMLHWPLQSVYLLFSEEDSWRSFPFLFCSVLLCGSQGPHQVSYKCDFSRKVLSKSMNRQTDTIHSHCFSTHFVIFFEPITKW